MEAPKLPLERTAARCSLRPLSVCWNLLPIGGLIGGAVAPVVSARFAVALSGAIVATNALLLLSSRRLRTIR